MCLIVWAHEVHPEYSLILAANRDEFYARPTRPAAIWEDSPGILAGRDEQAGGTWLGVTRTGRWAALTNYREPSAFNPGAPSRGDLVSDFLKGNDSIHTYLDRVETAGRRYNGFNLIMGVGGDMAYAANRNEPSRVLAPGIYGLSNKNLDTPWPKVVRSKALLEQIVRAGTIRIEDLFTLLVDDVVPRDVELPDTGVGLEWERRLGSIFIATPDYGTRSSTVLLIDRSGNVTFVERPRHPRDSSGDRAFTFTIEYD